MPLGALFYDLSARMTLSPKELMALINGSPCAAALLADTALAGRSRLAMAERAFALVARVTDAPQGHYAPELEEQEIGAGKAGEVALDDIDHAGQAMAQGPPARNRKSPSFGPFSPPVWRPFRAATQAPPASEPQASGTRARDGTRRCSHP